MGRTESFWSGKVAVVTGAAGGMGRELVLQLVAAGAHVAACDVNAGELEGTETLAKGLMKTTSCQKVSTHIVDVSDRPRVIAFVEEVRAEHGDEISALFNNAGVVCAQTTFETTFEEWDRVVAIDLYGVVNCTLAFLKHLTRAKEASVVNVSSLAGIVGMPGNSAYGTAKFGVRGFSEVLLAESRFLAPNLTVTVVHPGGIKTNIFNNSERYVHDTKLPLPGGVSGGLKNASELHDMLHMVGGTTPQEAAAQILGGVAKKQTRILIGTDVWLLDIVSRISPHFMLHNRFVNLGLPAIAVMIAKLVGKKVLFSVGVALLFVVRRRTRSLA